MGLSCLTNSKAVVVIDASTAINLNATGCAAQILKALPTPIVVTDVVVTELEEGRRAGRHDAQLLVELVESGLITIVGIAELQEAHFEALVVGRGVDTLDDGEAATIAYAVEKNGIALIDERKANRICAERYPHLLVGCTVDIFLHAAVQKSLGRVRLTDAIFAALQDARMRVLPQHVDWVVDLIGAERARQCSSLPRIARNALRPLADIP
jgi:predicted nucleic acid-binding protein